ncbi:MAG: AGE family epimerase/isomerase [Ignavibacteria bacterium]|jgi:mannose/cellobiose epimerase-like protein (N-acyl-D-glucosamine 2-epimerase family)
MNAKNITRKTFINILFLAIAVLFLISCSAKENEDVLDGSFWKNQALKQILPYWTRNARDTVYGAFVTNLDSVWKQFGSTNKYPSMISRHIFSYSTAYLLTGKKEYLDIASATVDFLLKNAWDKKYGGWFDLLDVEGKPIATTKRSFTQYYANTGLTIYYFVTHDKRVLEYIEKSNQLAETKRWDKELGGFYNTLERELKVKSDGKAFSSQIVPVSSYLLYLYLTTRETKYLEQAERIMNVSLQKMQDPESKWILESFDREWNYFARKDNLEKEINIGHNVETVWMFYRLYLLTGKTGYITSTKFVADKVLEWGFDSETGAWYNTVGRLNPSLHGETTYWWVQAYNNMFNLFQYRVTNDNKYLGYFRKGSEFWNTNFIDKKYGDTFFEVYTKGVVKEKKKAETYKTSYHSMETNFLNFLYLDFWVNKKPIELHFYITASEKGDKLYPCPIEDKTIQLEKVTINGKHWMDFDNEKACVNLPKLKNKHVKVVLVKY